MCWPSIEGPSNCLSHRLLPVCSLTKRIAKKDVVNLSCRAVPRPLMRKAACGSLCKLADRRALCSLSVAMPFVVHLAFDLSLRNNSARCTGLHNRRPPFALLSDPFHCFSSTHDMHRHGTGSLFYRATVTASDRSVVSDVPFALACAHFYLHAHSLSL